MGVPLRTRLAWALIAGSDRRPVMRQAAADVPAARRRRNRMLRIPGAWLVTGRPAREARISRGEVRLDGGEVLPARVYRPASQIAGPLPVVVNFHGGGWVSGDALQSEWWCAGIAARARVVVVSVEYRLAPEHRFPIPLDDCYAATAWTAANAGSLGCDPERLAVMGDSAGGNLAAAVCLMARDRGGPAIRAQVLIYPCVDLARDYPSAVENANAPLLQKGDIDNAPRLYLRDRDSEALNPLVSPIYADARGLPPAIIQTAEYDPLRDQGPAYADRLRAAGVEVRLVNYPGAVHGYISIPGIAPVARRALRDAAGDIAELLGS